MLPTFTTIASEIIQKALSSVMVNGFSGIMDFFGGQKTAQDAVYYSSKKIAKDIGYEAVRRGLNNAVGVIPGRQMVKGVACAAIDMAVNGTRAGVEGKEVARSVAKNGCYAINAAVAGPVCAVPLCFATDWVIDTAADLMTYAYNNYCIQKPTQIDHTLSTTSQSRARM